MSNRIVDLVLKDRYDQLGRQGITGAQRIDELQKQYNALRDEASTLRLLADLLDEESHPAATKKRVEAAAKAIGERAARGETTLSSSAGAIPMFTKGQPDGTGAHLDRMEQLAKAAALEQTLPALRKRAADAEAAAKAAMHTLSARSASPLSPIEREKLEDAVNDKDAAAKNAANELRKTDEQIAKLRGR